MDITGRCRHLDGVDRGDLGFVLSYHLSTGRSHQCAGGHFGGRSHIHPVAEVSIYGQSVQAGHSKRDDWTERHDGNGRGHPNETTGFQAYGDTKKIFAILSELCDVYL